jgi:AAA family ATP:ADP antiporter
VWAVKLKFLMTIVMACGVAIAATHAYIMHRAHAADGGAGRAAAKKAMAAAESAAGDLKRQNASRLAEGKKPKKPKTGLFDALRFVLHKPEVFCLALMSVSQGLSSILFQVAWKGQLRILHPSPQAYSAFMGDVQLMSGALTCVLMLAAPWLFKKLGWAGTLGVTPKSAMVLGWAFFGFSIWAAKAGFLVQVSPWLPVLVWGGSILYVIERAAKFSLFKPAEEMVYITLDDESRTKGKAAVDVLGAQVGKTGGSFMQQGLLLWCGTIVAALPALMTAHTFIVALWLWAVKRLDGMHGAELERMHAPEDKEEGDADAVGIAAA